MNWNTERRGIKAWLVENGMEFRWEDGVSTPRVLLLNGRRFTSKDSVRLRVALQSAGLLDRPDRVGPMWTAIHRLADRVEEGEAQQ